MRPIDFLIPTVSVITSGKLFVNPRGIFVILIKSISRVDLCDQIFDFPEGNQLCSLLHRFSLHMIVYSGVS